MESFSNFSVPDHEAWLALLLGVTAAIGEVGLTFYFIIKGRKTPKPKEYKIVNS
ncbi:MAG: hypothetical protein ACNS62_02470 [Candidatus Cyclobacteriaceae bacterium M3_2C_046]